MHIITGKEPLIICHIPMLIKERRIQATDTDIVMDMDMDMVGMVMGTDMAMDMVTVMGMVMVMEDITMANGQS